MRLNDEQMSDAVVLMSGDAPGATAASALGAVGAGVDTLDVAARGEGDHDLIVGDEVLFSKLGRLGLHNLGAPWVAVLLLQLSQIRLDEGADLADVGQDTLEVGNATADLGQLVLDLAALQRGQAAKLHVKDGLGLLLAEPEARLEVIRGGVAVLRAADRINYRVEVVERNGQAVKNVSARL